MSRDDSDHGTIILIIGALPRERHILHPFNTLYLVSNRLCLFNCYVFYVYTKLIYTSEFFLHHFYAAARLSFRNIIDKIIINVYLRHQRNAIYGEKQKQNKKDLSESDYKCCRLFHFRYLRNYSNAP